jgi:serine/threonine-protein phosphatase 2B catalytic subunit
LLGFNVDKCGHSAPNYLDAYQNKAAVIIYDQRLTVRQFTHQPHPYWLPNFMDAFTWTLPFVAQKIADMFHGLLSTISTDEMEEEEAREEDLQAEEIAARRMRIKQKIRQVGKMSRVFAVLREESEKVSELKRLEDSGAHEKDESDHLLMQGLLELGSEGIRKAIKDFDDAHVLSLRSQLKTNAQPGAARTLTMNGYRITRTWSWTMEPTTTILMVELLLVPVADHAA